MAKYSGLGEFNPGQEDCKAYCERLEQYFDVQEPEKQRAILLSGCGVATYQLIQNGVSPGKPTDHTFEALVKLVTEHHTPPPSVIMQRFRFNSHLQKEGETVVQYVAELRRLSEHCEFDNLDDMLQDRLVCSIANIKVQRRLLAEPKLVFKKAFELAQAVEVADSNAKLLQKPSAAAVHTVQKGPVKPTGGQNCYRCGGKHVAAECRFKDSECHFCHKRGHIAQVCRGINKRATTKPQEQHGRPDKKSTHRTCQLSEEMEDDTSYTMFAIGGERKSKPIKVLVQVNGAELEMEVDTGATCSIISEVAYQQLWSDHQAPRLRLTTRRLCTHTGEALSVKGTVVVTVQYGSQIAELELIVVAGEGPALFGRDWLQRIKLDWERLSVIRTTESLEAVLAKHPEVFKEDMGVVEGAPAKINIDPTAQPKFCRARMLPYALRAKVEQELERLQNTGVIELIQFSEWAAPIVPVVKKDRSVRICGDYKVTVKSHKR